MQSFILDVSEILIKLAHASKCDTQSKEIIAISIM